MKKKGIPYFLIVNNPNFEYICCLHDERYNGQSVEQYIINVYGFSNLSQFKSKKDIYSFLNTGNRNYKNMLSKLGRNKIIINEFRVSKRRFEVRANQTRFCRDALERKGSNVNEFFEVIDW